MRQHYVRPEAASPTVGYSHAVAFDGPTLFVSGQVALDANGELVGRDDPEAQLRQVFENLETVLTAAGSDLTKVLKMTVFLTDIGDLDAYRRVRAEYLPMDPPPASSLVQVVGLVDPAFLVEIEAIAEL